MPFPHYLGNWIVFGNFWFAEGKPKVSKQITNALSEAKGRD